MERHISITDTIKKSSTLYFFCCFNLPYLPLSQVRFHFFGIVQSQHKPTITTQRSSQFWSGHLSKISCLWAESDFQCFSESNPEIRTRARSSCFISISFRTLKVAFPKSTTWAKSGPSAARRGWMQNLNHASAASSSYQPVMNEIH